MDLIRRLREEMGWSQEHLAGAAGIGKRTVQRIEQGKAIPSPETATALAQALGVTPGELLRHSGLRARLRTLVSKWQRHSPTPDEFAELPADLKPGFTAFYEGLARLKAEEDETRRLGAQSEALHEERMKILKADAVTLQALGAAADFESSLQLVREILGRREAHEKAANQSEEISDCLFELADKHIALAANLTVAASRLDAVLYSYGVFD